MSDTKILKRIYTFQVCDSTELRNGSLYRSLGPNMAFECRRTQITFINQSSSTLDLVYSSRNVTSVKSLGYEKKISILVNQSSCSDDSDTENIKQSLYIIFPTSGKSRLVKTSKCLGQSVPLFKDSVTTVHRTIHDTSITIESETTGRWNHEITLTTNV